MTARASGDPKPVLAAVDWGTSSFRLWLLDAEGAVRAERRSAEGMSMLKPDQFETVLRQHLAATGLLNSGQTAPLPVIVCGMAGARTGWREAGYAEVPARLEAVAAAAIQVSAAGLDVRILPGLARRSAAAADVMRGEETQLLGLSLEDRGITAMAVMPGTHSKWVTLRDGRVDTFRSFMTGELFGLLSRQSLLKSAIGDSPAPTLPQSSAFVGGVRAGLERRGAVLSQLFAIRAANLLFATSAGDSVDRLSGLLIGAEIAEGLASAGILPLRLVAGGAIAQLYLAAFRQFDRDVTVVDADRIVLDGLRFAAGHLWPQFGW